MFGTSNTQYLTADGAVGTSGAPVRVFQATWLSDGTARSLVLRNGTADTAAIMVQAAGAISLTVTIDFGYQGMLFPLGCFFDIGSAVSAAITYTVEK